MNQEKRRIQTKNNILKAAAECFAEYGFEVTDVNKICKKVGLTKGAFYHHFSSKQELFLELLDRWINKVANQLDSAHLESKDTLKILINITEKIQPVFEEVDSQLPLFLELYIKAIWEPELKKVVIKSYQKFLNFFTDIIEKGIKEGSIKQACAEDVAKILFSITIGLLIQGLLNPQSTDWGDLAKKSFVLLLKR